MERKHQRRVGGDLGFLLAVELRAQFPIDRIEPTHQCAQLADLGRGRLPGDELDLSSTQRQHQAVLGIGLGAHRMALGKVAQLRRVDHKHMHPCLIQRQGAAS